MAKPKITRLGSSDNPFGKKVSAAQAAQSKRESERTTPRSAGKSSEKKEESFGSRAKKTLSKISDTLNPEKQLSSSAKKFIKAERSGNYFGGDRRKRKMDKAIKDSGG